jgi:hypothetical protein
LREQVYLNSDLLRRRLHTRAAIGIADGIADA